MQSRVLARQEHKQCDYSDKREGKVWGPGRGSMVPLWWELKEAISSLLLCFQSNGKQNVKQEQASGS